MGFGSLRELQQFVRQLDVPDDRREIVEGELLDHFFARVADGESERDALAAFGAPEALQIRFEAADRVFAFTRANAVADGVRFGLGLLLAFAVSDVVCSIVLDGLFGLLHFDPSRRFHLFWLVLEHGANPLLWSLAVVVPLSVALLLRPRRRGRVAAGRVAIAPGATAIFLLLACGIGLAGALFGEDLAASTLTRIGIEAANPDVNGRLLDLVLWLVMTGLALFQTPLRLGDDRTGQYIGTRGMLLP